MKCEIATIHRNAGSIISTRLIVKLDISIILQENYLNYRHNTDIVNENTQVEEYSATENTLQIYNIRKKLCRQYCITEHECIEDKSTVIQLMTSNIIIYFIVD